MPRFQVQDNYCCCFRRESDFVWQLRADLPLQHHAAAAAGVRATLRGSCLCPSTTPPPHCCWRCSLTLGGASCSAWASSRTGSATSCTSTTGAVCYCVMLCQDPCIVEALVIAQCQGKLTYCISCLMHLNHRCNGHFAQLPLRVDAVQQ